MPSLAFPTLPFALSPWLFGAVLLPVFFGTLLVVPWMVVRLPADYFHSRRRQPLPWAAYHPVLRWILLVLKNLGGLVLVTMGIAMLVLPGQGLLTILIGVLLLNFPGKFRLERWLVSRKPVLRAINWLRARRRRPPLVLD